MQEECRGWDVNKIVFSPGLWGTYHALMRADFTLFDEYAFTHEGASYTLCGLCLHAPWYMHNAPCRPVTWLVYHCGMRCSYYLVNWAMI